MADNGGRRMTTPHIPLVDDERREVEEKPKENLKLKGEKRKQTRENPSYRDQMRLTR